MPYRLPKGTENSEFSQAELEAITIGCLFENVDGEMESRDFLSEVVWVHPYHRIIFDAIMTIWIEGGIPDPDSIVRMLEGSTEWDMMEPITPEDLDDIENYSNEKVGVGNLAMYAKMLVDRSKNMKIKGIIQEVATQIHHNVDPSTISSKLVYEVSQIKDRQQRGMTLFEAIQRETGRVNKVVDTGMPFTGIPTGYKGLDRLLGGLHGGNLVLIAGRPGMGKTSLMNSVAFNASREESRASIFNLEMDVEQLVQRELAAIARVDSRMIRSGAIPPAGWPRYREACNQLSALDVYIDDSPVLTPGQLSIKIRKLAVEKPLDLVVIDYIQLMKADKEGWNRTENISNISRELKNIAREFDIVVLVAAQLNRAVEQRENKRPMLSDLRDSGSLEQDADIVMLLYRDEYYSPNSTDAPNQVEVNIAKHRNGPTGTVRVGCEMQFTRFFDLDTVRQNYMPTPAEEMMSGYGNKAHYDNERADY